MDPVTSAQTPTIFFDHVDLVARDFETGKAWWGKHFGAKPDDTIEYHSYPELWRALRTPAVVLQNA